MTHEAQAQLDRPLLDAGELDLDAAQRVTYVLRQRLRYDYDRPAYDLEHRLVVVPRAWHGNLRRRLHRVEVSVAGARVCNRRDAYGNVVVQVGVDVVPASIEFAVAAVVERVGPRLDAVLPASALSDQRLLRPTRLTAADEAIRELAAQIRADSSDHLEFAERCCAQVRAAISYQFGVTTCATTAAEALAGARGVCQDHAHVALAVCRAAGVPARYVSGHLLGDSGTHAWVEVVVADGDRARAVAFDPCNGCRAGSRHLPVAAGRDYTDVAPTSGRFAGAGRGRLSADKQLGVTIAA
ncbi:MAG: transglutaminase family protein [Pseudonocardiales bacterium]|nr:MAG: transglutaminase family protein [Pseudonocardiales bacterium]